MANEFNSNFTRKVMMKVLDRVESKRVLSKNVDTQLFQGQFTPNSGTQVDIKRPTDYVTVQTATGDISGNKSEIITAKATATVQNYLTVAVDFDEVDEALKMGTDKARFWDDIAERIVTDHETSFANFALKHTGLLSGTVGEGVDSWAEIANAGALMAATGVPSGDWSYFVDPFSQVALSNEQRSLGVNPEVGTANAKATIAEDFAGFNVKTATTLQTLRSSVGATRAGTLSADPDVTYSTNKDTMTQALVVTAFQANLVVVAGEQIEITGRNRLNIATKQIVLDEDMTEVTWTATVTETVTLNGSGAGTIVVTGPAIFEATGAYNTVDSAPVSGDLVTLLGSANTLVRPNLFWHRQAFSIAYVKLNKLHSTDTVATTRDGLSMRVSKYSDGDANKQTVRFDLLPAFADLNPFYAGQGYGTA